MIVQIKPRKRSPLVTAAIFHFWATLAQPTAGGTIPGTPTGGHVRPSYIHGVGQNKDPRREFDAGCGCIHRRQVMLSLGPLNVE